VYNVYNVFQRGAHMLRAASRGDHTRTTVTDAEPFHPHMHTPADHLEQLTTHVAAH